LLLALSSSELLFFFLKQDGSSTAHKLNCDSVLLKKIIMICYLKLSNFQVCDNEWHHYAVSVKFPDISLFVDGQLFKAEKKNPEIIDDWPLHPTKGINTTVTVGACWQGK
jgi:hypothetical protein